jgi:hypothetical protein
LGAFIVGLTTLDNQAVAQNNQEMQYYLKLWRSKCNAKRNNYHGDGQPFTDSESAEACKTFFRDVCAETKKEYEQAHQERMKSTGKEFKKLIDDSTNAQAYQTYQNLVNTSKGNVGSLLLPPPAGSNFLGVSTLPLVKVKEDGAHQVTASCVTNKEGKSVTIEVNLPNTPGRAINFFNASSYYMNFDSHKSKAFILDSAVRNAYLEMAHLWMTYNGDKPITLRLAKAPHIRVEQLAAAAYLQSLGYSCDLGPSNDKDRAIMEKVYKVEIGNSVKKMNEIRDEVNNHAPPKPAPASPSPEITEAQARASLTSRR